MNQGQSDRMAYNFHLALLLVWKSLSYHRLVSLSTILGVASGMCVVTTILIVDHNTVMSGIRQEQLAETIVIPADEKVATEQNSAQSQVVRLPIRKIGVIKWREEAGESISLATGHFPNQALRASVSAGIKSTARGEEDYQTMRLVILPQAIRRILPPLTSQAISLIKDSSLVSVIAIYEMTMNANEIASETFLVFEIFFTIAAIYLALALTLSRVVAYFEKRYRVVN